jgi:hypothetical protein
VPAREWIDHKKGFHAGALEATAAGRQHPWKCAGFPETEQEEGNWNCTGVRNKYARDFAGVVIVSHLYDCIIKFPVLSSCPGSVVHAVDRYQYIPLPGIV